MIYYRSSFRTIRKKNENKKNVACDILAPSAVAFMQHIPIARVRILSEAFLFHRKCGAISYEMKKESGRTDLGGKRKRKRTTRYGIYAKRQEKQNILKI